MLVMETKMAKVSVNGERKVFHRRVKKLCAYYRKLIHNTPVQQRSAILQDKYLSCEHAQAIDLACRSF